MGVHPDFGKKGINASTGSLGHGLGMASGMALAKKDNTYFVLLSDGELHEGSVWGLYYWRSKSKKYRFDNR